MKKNIIIIFLGLLFTNIITAQINSRNWSDGKLTWNDFTEKQSKTEFSGFQYFIEYKNGKENQNDTTVLRFNTFCFLDRTQTWTLPEYKTDQYLRYNQVLFDIAEIHRRILQDRLDRINTINSSDIIFQNLINECKVEIDRFKNDSQDGQNMKTIVLWEQIVANKLAKINPEKLPDYKIKDFGYGCNIGFGNNIFAGKLNNYFSPSLNFDLGIGIFYKNSIFWMNTASGRNNVINDFTLYENLWNKGMKTSYSNMNICYGYSTLNLKKIRLAPFVGLGFVEESEIRTDTYKGLKLKSTNAVGGLSFYYKFSNTLSIIPNSYQYKRNFYENSILAKLYITKTNFGNELKGFSINLGISYNFLEKGINLVEN